MNSYQHIVSRLAKLEPRNGYSNIRQIELTDQEVATVMNHEPLVISAALAKVSPMAQAVVYWAMQASMTKEHADRRLVALMKSLWRAEAKRVLLLDLQQECARRKTVQSNIVSFEWEAGESM